MTLWPIVSLMRLLAVINTIIVSQSVYPSISVTSGYVALHGMKEFGHEIKAASDMILKIVRLF